MPKLVYTREMLSWLRETIPGRRLSETVEMFNRRFDGSGVTMSYSKVHALTLRLGVKTGLPRCPVKGRPTELWPTEAQEWMRRNLRAHTYASAQAALRELTGREYTIAQLKHYAHGNGLVSAYNGRFLRGDPRAHLIAQGEHVSPGTEFRQGNNTGNLPAPVGTVSRSSDGHLLRKIAEPNKWKLVHRLVYEENFGEIPEGMLVQFLDGNHDNCSPDNLVLVSRAEQAVINRYRLRTQDPELMQAGINVAKILIARRRKRNG